MKIENLPMALEMGLALSCPYAEYEAYPSTRWWIALPTVVCRHPHNAGCLCAFDPHVGGVCPYCAGVRASEEDGRWKEI